MRFAILALTLIITGNCKSSASPSPSPGKPSTDFCAAGERPMVVTNKSSQTVWVGLTSGSFFCRKNTDCKNIGENCVETGKDAQGSYGTCGCTSDDLNCGELGICTTNTEIGTTGQFMCFWKLPRMVNAQTPKLSPTQSLKLCFPTPLGALSKGSRQTNALSSVQWSGNLFARLGCDSNGQNCDSGECSTNNSSCKNNCGPGYTPPSGHTYEQDCPNNGSCAPQDGTCNAGTGGVPPASLAEFTFTAPQPNQDYYDVSIINGINIGIAMEPDSKTTTKSKTDPYFCAMPGALTQNDPFGVLKGCSWEIKPTIFGKDQSTLLRQVIPTKSTTCLSGSLTGAGNQYCECTSNSKCPTGQICGLAQNTGIATVAKVCGKFVAYWSADQICGSNPGSSNISPLQCGKIEGTTYTYLDMFGCTGSAPASCYQDVTSCDCGCPTYQNANPDWPKVLDSQGNCTATNQTWVNNIQPWLVFMKKACPTAYTFPYDDKTSTFTCYANAGINAGEAPAYYVDFFDLK